LTEDSLLSKLEKSWKLLCIDFSEGKFYPISENDITCYLYYSLIANQGILKNQIHTEVPVNEGKEVDILLEPLDGKNGEAPILVEIKFWKQKLSYYLGWMRSNDDPKFIFRGDIEKLVSLDNFGQGVAIVFFQNLPPSPYYKEKSKESTLRKWEDCEAYMHEIQNKLTRPSLKILYGPLLEYYRPESSAR